MAKHGWSDYRRVEEIFRVVPVDGEGEMLMNSTMISTASTILLAAGVALPTITLAQGNPVDPPVYGSQLMTEQERLEYREQLREAQTLEEREQLRSEHVERMQQRARDQGANLPDDRPGMGQGTGQGMGQGMGPPDDGERGRQIMPNDGLQPREGQGRGMDERYREEHHERGREHTMDNDEYRGGSGMGGGRN